VGVIETLKNHNGKIFAIWGAGTLFLGCFRETLKDMPVLGFMSSRVPGFYENFEGTVIYAGVQTAMGNIIGQFGSNPSAKTIFRDVSKIVSTTISAISETEVGSTDIYHGTGHIISAVFKPICKFVMISTATTFLSAAKPLDVITAMIDISGAGGQFSFSKGGRIANYICEPASRFFIVAEKDRQIHVKESNITDIGILGYVNYVEDNFKWDWVWKAASSIPSKVIVSDAFGQLLIADVGIGSLVKDSIGGMLNPLYSLFKNVAPNNELIFKYQDGVVGKIIQLFKMDSINIGYKTAVSLSIVTPQFLGKFTEEYIMTYLLATDVRIASDAVDNFIDHTNATATIHDTINIIKGSLHELFINYLCDEADIREYNPNHGHPEL